jgi:FtsH-binding integral membrane protein
VLCLVRRYLGLLVFSGYVLFDTQLVVERASAGDFDQIQHALDLFVDFMAIAVRVLIILMKNQEEKEKRKRRRND